MNYSPYPMYGYQWPVQGNYTQPNQIQQIGNQYPQYQQYQMQQTPQQVQQVQNINGKYVDSIDVVKATEVPMGGSGIFPKADLSEIYIKSWNADGTTRVMTFKPVSESAEAPTTGDSALMGEILAKVEKLNSKLDKLSSDLGG